MIGSNKFKTYLFSYRHEGQDWLFEMKADSADDAKRRLSRLAFASYDGELMAKVPTVPGITNWLSHLITFAMTLLSTGRSRK